MTTRRTRASSPLGSGSAEGHGLIAEEDVSFGANADATLDDPTVLLGKATAGSGNQTGQPAPVTADGEPDAGPAYPAALRRERDWLKSMNDVLEKAADDFDAVADKMLRVTSTTASSHALLDVYSRILTQAEHTHQLLRDPSWKGATHDSDSALALAQEKAAQELAEAQARLAREASARQAQTAAVKGGAHLPNGVREARGRGARGTGTRGRATAGIPAEGRGRGSDPVRGSSRIGRVRGSRGRPE